MEEVMLETGAKDIVVEKLHCNRYLAHYWIEKSRDYKVFITCPYCRKDGNKDH